MQHRGMYECPECGDAVDYDGDYCSACWEEIIGANDEEDGS